VFVFMTVNAKILPVRAVGRVVGVVAVPVVDGEEMAFILLEFPPALGADETVDLQRLFPIAVLRDSAPELRDDFGDRLRLPSRSRAGRPASLVPSPSHELSSLPLTAIIEDN
jgi:hypothetical protein